MGQSSGTHGYHRRFGTQAEYGCAARDDDATMVMLDAVQTVAAAGSLVPRATDVVMLAVFRPHQNRGVAAG